MPAHNKRFGARRGVRPQKVLSEFESFAPARTFVKPRPVAKRPLVLDVNYQTFPDGGVGEKYIPLRNFDKSLFTEDEIETLKKVKKRLKDVSTQDVIKLSHQEKAWTEANENKTDPIDYTFAYDLTLF